MNVRPLQRDDREPLSKLLVATGVFTAVEVEIALELIDAVLNCPDHRDYIINVCTEQDKVIGYYCVGPTPATEATYDMYWIASHPSRHGNGIGSLLDEHATALVRSRGGRLVIAETSSRPPYEKTRRFYLSRGYSEVARIREYYRKGDDLVVYGKYLT